MIYHPRIARAGTYHGEDREWYFYGVPCASQAYSGLLQVITEMSQSCNTPGHSIATYPTLLSWCVLQQTPMLHCFTRWGMGVALKRSIKMVLWSFHPLTFHSTFPSVCSTTLYRSISRSVCFPSYFLIPPRSTYPSLLSCVIRRDFLTLSISISSFSLRVLWQEECIVYFGTPFVTLLIYF